MFRKFINHCIFVWSKITLSLPRQAKKFLLIAFDFVVLIFSYLFVLKIFDENILDLDVMAQGIFFVLTTFLYGKLLGVYKEIIRFSGIYLFWRIVLTQILSIFTFSAILTAISIHFPNIFYLFLCFVSITALGGGRLIARQFSHDSHASGKRILIYGAGSAGIQLLNYLKVGSDYEVIAFIDDQSILQKKTIHGLKVIDAKDAPSLVNSKNIEMIALAMPKSTKQQLRLIINKLDNIGIPIKTVPSFYEIFNDKSSITDLREIDVLDLLGRAPVSPNQMLLKKNIVDKIVLVTGAGGSIGSEICRQVVLMSPIKLILLDHSEVALFNIQRELENDGWGHLIKPVLGSVSDQFLVENVMKIESVNTIYHAAAYKHVPLVEFNPFAAIENNVFGTQALLKAAVHARVSSFTLISSDKAVRPTNVMGASKRLAEILCQTMTMDENTLMSIATVRFGNVLGSSGSVIPIFREQIKSGGPVTVTHREITRYFMTIPEAVQLVLQASSMANKGQVFVLDMGEPIKIDDLAKKMITLSGYAVSDIHSPEPGKITINYTGLRPGEKLHEELLISGRLQETEHERIFMNTEDRPPVGEFSILLRELRQICLRRDESLLRDFLLKAKIGYRINDFGETKKNCVSSIPDMKNSKQSLTKKHTLHTEDINASYSTALEKLTVTSKIGRKKTFFFEKIFIMLLHKYFLISRPLTLGVRCVILNHQQQVLLVKHTYISGWHLPGGGLNPGESAQNAISREVEEETGLILEDEPKCLGIFHNSETTNRDHIIIFLSQTSQDLRRFNNSIEIKEAKFFNYFDLPKDLDLTASKLIMTAMHNRGVNKN